MNSSITQPDSLKTSKNESKRAPLPHAFKPGNRASPGRGGAGGKRQQRTWRKRANAEAKLLLLETEVADLRVRVEKHAQAILKLLTIIQGENHAETKVPSRSAMRKAEKR